MGVQVIRDHDATCEGGDFLLGAVSVRAPVGHRPRGLQCRRQRLGAICRTSTPAAVPIAGARTASPVSAIDRQHLCLSLALWNGRDPILKERLFGLTNSQGNHGEDVKELYYYLDATPTHSYLKMLYKYPQGRFPTPGCCRRTGSAAERPSSSCWIPACSTKTATSMCSSSTHRPHPTTS
jgi:hypothetical protein